MDDIIKLPKVDLHCHLDGSVRTQTIIDIARRQNYELPTYEVNELRKFVRVPADCKSLGEFLKRFEFFYPLLNTPYAVERITYELCRDCSIENIKYLEIRFAPVLQRTDTFSVEQVIEASLKGMKRGENDFSIKCGIILCLYRGTSAQDISDTAKYAIKFKNDGVCGIDVAGDESRYSLDVFKTAIEKCKEEGLFVTIHAGEAAGPENIRKAIEIGADRIGHGVSLERDEQLMLEVAEKEVPLEICITSNIHTQVIYSYDNHPFKKFIDNGVKITLNTDDRGVSGIDLTYEYQKALSLGLSHKALIEIILNGIEYAFLPTAEKEKLRKEYFATFK